MLKWNTSARYKNVPLSRAIIREKAKEFVAALGRDEFLVSVEWLIGSRKGIISSKCQYVARGHLWTFRLVKTGKKPFNLL